MAQAAAIAIADGSAVSTTFNPEKVTPEVSTFVDRTTGVASRFRRLTTRFSPANNNRLSTRTALDVSIPIWGTLTSGASGVLYTLRAKVEYVLPDGCSTAERNDLHAFVSNALSNTLVRGNLRDLDPMY